MADDQTFHDAIEGYGGQLSYAPGEAVESYEARYFSSLSDEELLDTFGGVGYLVGESQRQAFESLPNDAKRRFLTEFFVSGDADESPTRNSLLDEYVDRLGRVRMQYGEMIGKGERPPWTTDTGLIYLRFGEPDERLINHFPSGSDTNTVGMPLRASGPESVSCTLTW